jgi:hypothetical protein
VGGNGLIVAVTDSSSAVDGRSGRAVRLFSIGIGVGLADEPCGGLATLLSVIAVNTAVACRQPDSGWRRK